MKCWLIAKGDVYVKFVPIKSTVNVQKRKRKMNCPNCNWPMVMFTGSWYCRKCGAKKPFEDLGYEYGKTDAKKTKGEK